MPFATSTPQPEQVCDVEAGSTATTSRTTSRPALTALKERMAKNALHPASLMLLAR
jgi:hypothetical protein